MSEESDTCCYCEKPLPPEGSFEYADCESCDYRMHPQCGGLIYGEFMCLKCIMEIKAQIEKRLKRERRLGDE